MLQVYGMFVMYIGGQGVFKIPKLISPHYSANLSIKMYMLQCILKHKIIFTSHLCHYTCKP